MYIPISYEQVLRSGRYNYNYLVDIKSLLGSPSQAELYREMAALIPEGVDAVCGLVASGAVIAAGLSLYMSTVLGRPTSSFYVRKEVKSYDRISIVEGNPPPAGSRVAIVDDFLGSGKSIKQVQRVCNDLGLLIEAKVVACQSSRSLADFPDVKYLFLSSPYRYPEATDYRGRKLSVKISYSYDRTVIRGSILRTDGVLNIVTASSEFLQLDEYSLKTINRISLPYIRKDRRTSTPSVNEHTKEVFISGGAGELIKIGEGGIESLFNFTKYYRTWAHLPHSPVLDPTGPFVYVGLEIGSPPNSSTGGVMKLSTKDLSPVQFFPSNGLVASRPLLEGSYLYFGANDGLLYKYRTFSGKEDLLWASDLQSEVRGEVVDLGSTLLVCTKDSFIVCVSKDFGGIVWKRRIAAFNPPVQDPVTGNLVGVARNGSPFLLSKETGDVIEWVRHDCPDFGSPCIRSTPTGYVYSTVNSIVECDFSLKPLRVLNVGAAVGNLLVTEDSLYIETSNGVLDRIALYAS